MVVGMLITHLCSGKLLSGTQLNIIIKKASGVTKRLDDWPSRRTQGVDVQTDTSGVEGHTHAHTGREEEKRMSKREGEREREREKEREKERERGGGARPNSRGSV
jgi:hypothetical protein